MVTPSTLARHPRPRLREMTHVKLKHRIDIASAHEVRSSTSLRRQCVPCVSLGVAQWAGVGGWHVECSVHCGGVLVQHLSIVHKQTRPLARRPPLATISHARPAPSLAVMVSRERDATHCAVKIRCCSYDYKASRNPKCGPIPPSSVSTCPTRNTRMASRPVH